MAKITLRRISLILILLIFQNSLLLAQRTTIELSIKKQIELSDQAIEAEILSSESFWDSEHHNIYTKHTLKVYKVFKGQNSATVDMIVPGGVLDFEAEKVSHSIELKQGDVGMFMLRSTENSRKFSSSTTQLIFEAVGADQSYFRYDLATNRAANPYQKLDDISNKLYTEVIEASNLSEPLVISDLNVLLPNKTSNKRLTEVYRKVNSFSATEYTAGTNAVLTVTGEGFGVEKGTVAFSNADYGGYLKTDVLPSQILSWTDSEIKVEIPEFAGTGLFTIKTTDGSTVDSSSPITINYAQTNMEYNLGSGNTAFNTRHIATNGEGGYSFTMNSNFASSGAKPAFMAALENWSCQTGINWEMSSDITNENRDVEDGINLITFDENNSMPASKLAQCKSRYKACYEDGSLKWYVTEMDLIFNDRSDWNFSEAAPGNSAVDLQSVALHELGHGHQLNHVIDMNKIMHYSIVAGDMKREIGAYDLAGALDVESRSTSAAICGRLSMTNVSCSTLDTEDFVLNSELTFFPNPAKDYVNINNKGNSVIKAIEIYAINGSKIQRVNYSNPQKILFNVSHLAQGLYMMNIETDFGNVMHKLVVN
ncbi:Por secretion system C-terminal sorting domain-containing protein [Flavobacteriaceae bacterium MAR_2010_188]|nr:Por secretion system C-terminal sorting domain-containing protein [Flavobacteriaceae bacterium MAR_2010_188]